MFEDLKYAFAIPYFASTILLFSVSFAGLRNMSTPGSFGEKLLPSVGFNISMLEFCWSKVFMQDLLPTVSSTTALIAALTVLSSTVVVLIMLEVVGAVMVEVVVIFVVVLVVVVVVVVVLVLVVVVLVVVVAVVVVVDVVVLVVVSKHTIYMSGKVLRGWGASESFSSPPPNHWL